MTEHHYTTNIRWIGNRGTGTSRYDEYDRNHILSIENKPDLNCSSDTVFRGDNSRHNPEDMLVAALSSCHMLWYLHLCADAGVIVTEYSDSATGTLSINEQGNGCFSRVTLHPTVVIKLPSMIDKAIELHELAHKKCFIANSCNFPVTHKPICKVKE